MVVCYLLVLLFIQLSNSSTAVANNTYVITNATNTSILSADAYFIIIAKDNANNNASDTELFYAELWSRDSCITGTASSSCQVLCYPYTLPHTSSPECVSSTNRVTLTQSTALWSIANVISLGNALYQISFINSIEISGYYIPRVYLLNVGGLRAKYYDNIWLVGNIEKQEIDYVINHEWGNGPITTYGQDYISVQWYGKIKPPYNETYTFYITADDGARLWIDNQLIIDTWESCCNEIFGSVTLTSYTFHDIKVEYREIRDNAHMHLKWSSPSISKTYVTGNYLYYVDEISSSPLPEIYIKPGPANGENTIVNDITPFSNNIAGVNNSVYITVKDAFNQIIEQDTSTFITTNLTTITTSTYIGSGIYQITFMSNIKTNNGSYTNFSILLNDNTPINGSPFSLIISPDITSPLNSSLSGIGLTSGNAGQLSKFDIIVYDKYLNERETGNDVISIRFYNTAPGSGICEYYKLGYGIYNCSYTLTIAGVYNIEILVNSIDISNGLSTITIDPGVIHGPSCTYVANTNLTSGVLESITIQARDQFNNPLTTSSDVFIVTTSDNNEITATSNGVGTGLYTATFTPTISGVYPILIKLNGLININNSPYNVYIINGNVSPINSLIIDGNGHISSQVNIETYIIIQTRDINNNNLNNNFGSFTTKSILCSTTIVLNCLYINNGQHNCSYTPTESGLCTLTIQISGTNIINSPFSVNIIPGIVNADETIVYGINNGTVGDIFSFTIQSKDIYSNNLTNGGNIYLMELIDNENNINNINGNIIDNLDGTYTVTYECTKANIYDYINIKLHSVGGLIGNYYTDYSLTNLYNNGINILTPKIEFDWGYGEPYNNIGISDYFSITYIGQIKVPYSETYTFYTPIYAGSGVKLYINNILVIDQWIPNNGETQPFAKIQLTKNILYDISLYFRELNGKSKISLLWESASIQKQVISSDYLYYKKNIANANSIASISILPSITNALNTIIKQSITSTTVGISTNLTIITKDTYSNIQTSAGDESSKFLIQLISSNSSIIVNGTINAYNSGLDGLYNASFILTETGTYTLNIYFNNIPINSSPLIINALPNTIDGTTSNATILNGRTGELQTFYLYLKDSYNNLCQCGGNNNPVTIILTLTHFDGITKFYASDIVSDGNGLFTIKYTVIKSGDYSIQILANSINITNITPTISMSSPIADAHYSYIIGWENGVNETFTAGVEYHKIIQLVDIYNYNIQDSSGYYLYSVILQDNTEINRPTLTNLSNGQYNISFTLPSSGIYTLKISLANGDYSTSYGLTGHYFNNRWLHGTPIDIKIDSNLSINWNTGLITSTAKDFISIRWTGYILPQYSEQYSFKIISDDGVRLYIDNTLIINNFLDNANTFTGLFTFTTSNILYPIIIEYRENTDIAKIDVLWNSSTLGVEQQIPTNNLFDSVNDIKSTPFTIIGV